MITASGRKGRPAHIVCRDLAEAGRVCAAMIAGGFKNVRIVDTRL
jgi:hypothetical protein